MSDGLTHYDLQRQAAEAVAAEMEKPVAETLDDWGGGDTFDPWVLFPCLFGTYSQAFDNMALDVLRSLALAAEDDWDAALALQRKETLAHEMFREILCNAELCDYGTSPRVCFSTCDFRPLLRPLIEKWEAFSRMHWGEQEAA